MVSDTEIERAKDTMANGILAVWLTHSGEPSKQLDAVLDENPDISVEVWLDVLTRVKDPRLVAYVVQYLNLEQGDLEAVDSNATKSVGLFSKQMITSWLGFGFAMYWIGWFILELLSD